MRIYSRLRRWRSGVVLLPVASAIALAAVLLPAASFALPQTAPNNTGEPSISLNGKPIEGKTLTANRGSWSGSTPMSFAYRWLRCPQDGGAPDGSNCAPISGEAGSESSYRLRDADVGFRIRVRVTATNADGSDSAASNPTGRVRESSSSPPNNTGEPRIVGAAVEGRTLTANRGSWSGSTPMSFAYRWLRCPQNGGAPDGSNCAPIAGDAGSESSYRLREADVGIRIRVRVTATNADGSDSAASNPTEIVQGSARPRVVTAPSISGQPIVGSTLTADRGTWSGTQPITYAYQWRSCNRSGGNCSSISGATARTYGLKQSDLGTTVRVRVTARNSVGEHTVTTAPTAVITAEAATGCPAGNGPINISQLTPPARLLVDRFQVTPNPIPLSAQSLVVRFHVTACGGRDVAGAIVYVTAVPFNQFAIPSEQQTGGDGWVTMRMNRLRGFPAADNQSLLVMFVRARKGGEPILSGVSTRRLISFQLASRALASRTSAVTRTPSAAAAPRVSAACPGGAGPMQVDQVTPPARLQVDRFQVVPNPVPLATDSLTVRVHVSACGGRDVAGALVYTTAVPFNQFSIPSEQRTGADGWATLNMSRLDGFPAATKQSLLVMFVRARKNGEPILSGISTRRLISFRLAR